MNAFSDLARGKRNWQLVTFGVTGALVVLAMTTFRLATASHVVPYVIQVDRFGQVLTVGTAEQMTAPDQRLIASQLAQFLRAVRTVLPASAAAAQAEMLRRAYAFASPEAAGFLNEHFANAYNDPRVLGWRVSRQVDITAVLRVPSSDVWRLRWAETERAIKGDEPVRNTAWEGYVTVRLTPPRSAETVQENPLGIYVTSISWTQLAESYGRTADDSSRIPAVLHDTGASR
jgi:type IV secretion system protein VirB5